LYDRVGVFAKRIESDATTTNNIFFLVYDDCGSFGDLTGFFSTKKLVKRGVPFKDHQFKEGGSVYNMQY